MLEIAELLGSILSNRTEVHSLELGVQIGLLFLLIISYGSEELGAGFLSVVLGSVFVFQPIRVVQAKPWYFLSGILIVLFVIEVCKVTMRTGFYSRVGNLAQQNRIVKHFK